MQVPVLLPDGKMSAFRLHRPMSEAVAVELAASIRASLSHRMDCSLPITIESRVFVPVLEGDPSGSGGLPRAATVQDLGAIAWRSGQLAATLNSSTKICDGSDVERKEDAALPSDDVAATTAAPYQASTVSEQVLPSTIRIRVGRRAGTKSARPSLAVAPAGPRVTRALHPGDPIHGLCVGALRAIYTPRLRPPSATAASGDSFEVGPAGPLKGSSEASASGKVPAPGTGPSVESGPGPHSLADAIMYRTGAARPAARVSPGASRATSRSPVVAADSEDGSLPLSWPQDLSANPMTGAPIAPSAVPETFTVLVESPDSDGVGRTVIVPKLRPDMPVSELLSLPEVRKCAVPRGNVPVRWPQLDIAVPGVGGGRSIICPAGPTLAKQATEVAGLLGLDKPEKEDASAVTEAVEETAVLVLGGIGDHMPAAGIIPSRPAAAASAAASAGASESKTSGGSAAAASASLLAAGSSVPVSSNPYADGAASQDLLERVAHLMSTDPKYYSLIGSLVKRENDMRRSEERQVAMHSRESTAASEWMDEATEIQKMVVAESPEFLAYFGGSERLALAALRNAQWDFPEHSIAGKHNRCAWGLLQEGDGVPCGVQLADFDGKVEPADAIRIFHSPAGSGASAAVEKGGLSESKTDAPAPIEEHRWKYASLRQRCSDLWRRDGRRWAILAAGSAS